MTSESRIDQENAPAGMTRIDSPVGRLAIVERDGAIVRLSWQGDPGFGDRRDTPVLKEAARQIAAYFAGELTDFDLPLRLSSNTFQRQVQEAMLAIPHGATRTYGDIARDLGTYGQPVGQACGNNAIPIIVPCHRVLSATGLGGYSGEGGIETKIRLLKHEGGYPFLV